MSERIPAIFERPQIHLSCSSRARMGLVSLCCAAAVVQSSLNDSGASLLVAGAALLGALASEFLFGLKTKRQTIFDGSAVASALVLSLLLPNTIHPAFAAIGAVFAIAVVKLSFGGLGSSWFNPALGGWLFVRAAFPNFYTQALNNAPITVSFQEGANPALGALIQNGVVPANLNITEVLNSKILAYLHLELPASFIEFFASGNAAIIADRGVYAIIIGSIIMIALRVSRYIYSAIFLFVYVLFIKMGGALMSGGVWWNGDVFMGLLGGGTFAAAFFLLCEPSSSPKTGRGKVFCAVLAALLSYFFRYTMGEFYGVFYAIAIINMMVPVIRRVECAAIFEKIPVRGYLNDI